MKQPIYRAPKSFLNRMPLVVPCHRVLAAGGALGGFSAPQGLAMKRRLLAMETA